jgi:ABC-type branched-subunit amino acid transport system permease subunit/ABC-type branched-subunit amino acid transport system ATPase component
MSALAITISEQIVFNGIVLGMVYGLVAIGIVLVFRASGVINFAQGQFGAFGATLMAVLYVNEDIPFWLTVPLAIASGALIGGLTELLVVRRLFHQPRLLLFVATVGVAQVILLVQIQLPEIDQVVSFPTPIDERWNIGSLAIRGDQLLVLIAVPLIALLFALVMQRTKFGLSVRSAADNASAASLAGIRVRAVSTQVWITAGVLASVSALLAGPVLNQRAGDVAEALGPSLLLYSLAAALVGGMTSFPLAMLGGVVLGVVDRVVLANTPEDPGTNTLVIFVLLVVFVLLRARSQSADESSWNLTPRTSQGRQELLRHPLARVMRYGGIAVLLALGLLLPQFETLPSRLIDYSTVLVFLMVAVSATVLTGWAGQLSLGQFAFVAIGAYLTAYYSQSLGFLVCVLLGTLWGIGIAIVIGIPALRVRGLYLGIITLGFALTVSGYVILQDRFNTSFTGLGASLDPPVVFGYDFAEDKQAYYYFCLACALAVILIVSHFRRTGMGRSLLAVRDNETNAAAYTVSPTRAKLVAFAISGGVAAFAGGLFAAGHTTQIPDYFAPAESLRVLAISVVGGLSSVTGAVLGTLVIVAIPTVFEGSAQLQLFASGVGMLILLLYCPGGLVSIVDSIRDQMLAFIARRTDWKPPQRRTQASVAHLSDRVATTEAARSLPLRTRDVSVSFGGRPVVVKASIEVRDGEVVGLIGTNGAGKTTLMNAISGFVKSTGEIEVFGRRIEHAASYRRARQGVGRAFQNARGFGGLSVRETIMVGLEARQRSLLVPSLLALPPSPMAERRKRKQADEIIGYLGLGRYADTLMVELSTGTRRIVELGALLALDARLVLLDEPTAGVAQKETETFGPLIKTIQRELGSSILIVEHDMPMVMSISDRIYCLEAGQVIAEGTPTEVRNDPRVISSYLGTDERAIQRSGERAETRADAPATVGEASDGRV